MTVAATSRVITVPAAVWEQTEQALSMSSLLLHRVPAAPGQVERYEVKPRSQRSPARHGLSEQEVKVLTGISKGRSNREIGLDLYLTEDTVKTHASRMFRKLGALNRAHAVDLGWRLGVLR